MRPHCKLHPPAMRIDQDLHELLFCHDCVIVPEWGGFLTQYRGARLDANRNLVHPPGKDLSFNRHLVRNDGLLADRIARREGLDFTAASARVGSAVAEWRAALDRNGRLEVPRIGVFYRDQENNLQFDPDKGVNFLKDAYGLRPVVAKPVPVVRSLPVNEPESIQTKRAPVGLLAAASLALLLATSVTWFVASGGMKDARWSGLDPFHTPERTYTAAIGMERLLPIGSFTVPEGLVGVHTLPVAPNDAVSVTVDMGGSMAVPDSTAVAARTVVTTRPKARYHIVGGCFAQEENADRLFAQLRAAGYDAVRLPAYRGLHPVAYGSYVRKQDALDALSAVRAETTNAAWLLVR